MNAETLATLLLEMDVINIPELRREITKLAAHVADPLAQRWFQRAGNYWTANIDKLMATPYKAVAEPRTIRGAQGYYEPFPRDEVPLSTPTWNKPAPENRKLYPFKTGLEDATPKERQSPKDRPNPHEGHFPESRAQVLVRHVLEADTLNPTDKRCPDCKGTGKIDGKNCPQCDGSGRIQPDPEGIHTSRFHEPDLQNQIDQNFTKFQPSKAKPLGKTKLGEPPPKEKLPAYATGDQEFYHFNPIQARQRELFQRLIGVVHFLNYKSRLSKQLLTGPDYATALAEAEAGGTDIAAFFKKEQEDAKKAVEFLKFLGGQSPENVDLFRQIIRDSRQYARDIVEKPWLYDTGSKLIASDGPYKIIKVTSGTVAKKLSSRAISPLYKGLSAPRWCTSGSHADSYLKQGPLYFIDKDGQPFILIHLETGQAKMPDNSTAPTPDVARAVAPVILKNKQFAALVQAEGGDQNSELRELVKALRQR